MKRNQRHFRLLSVVATCFLLVKIGEAFLLPSSFSTSSSLLHAATKAPDTATQSDPKAATYEGKLVVLTREAGKNDKLRARLEPSKVRSLKILEGSSSSSNSSSSSSSSSSDGGGGEVARNSRRLMMVFTLLDHLEPLFHHFPG